MGKVVPKLQDYKLQFGVNHGIKNVVFSKIFFAFITSLSVIISSHDKACRVQDHLKARFQDSEDTFDFIIVGSGTAGSLLANRLSENHKVLLLEAGGDPHPLQSIPGMAFFMLNFKETDWMHRTAPQKRACFSSPKRRASWSQGRNLGGTGNLNFMTHLRGSPRDYDYWSKLTGDRTWNYRSVMPYFKRFENYRGDTPDQDAHGSDGELQLEIPGYTGIAKEFIRAGQEIGYEHVDLNARFDEGFDTLFYPLNIGERRSSYGAFIEPAMERRTLVIRKYSHVNKILIRDFDKSAFGVEYDRHGLKRSAYATKEVILSAGTVNTPKLLMLSGIGPRSHLKDMGIHVISDLPVGSNLQDHLFTYLGPFFVDPPRSNLLDRDLTFQRVYDYKIDGSGPLSSSLFQAAGMISSKSAKSAGNWNWPDILLLCSSMGAHKSFPRDLSHAFNLSPDLMKKYYGHAVGKDSFFIAISAARPFARGSVSLEKRDPYSAPIIDPKYLEDDHDLNVMMEGIKVALHMVENTTAFQELRARFTHKKFPGCEHMAFRSDEYWECYVRRFTISMNDGVGTCPMGNPHNTKHAVVNSKLQVMGVKNLRVVDASVMPTIVSSQTQAAVMMIAEKAADMINEVWLTAENMVSLGSPTLMKPASPFNKNHALYDGIGQNDNPKYKGTRYGSNTGWNKPVATPMPLHPNAFAFNNNPHHFTATRDSVTVLHPADKNMVPVTFAYKPGKFEDPYDEYLNRSSIPLNPRVPESSYEIISTTITPNETTLERPPMLIEESSPTEVHQVDNSITSFSDDASTTMIQELLTKGISSLDEKAITSFDTAASTGSGSVVKAPPALLKAYGFLNDSETSKKTDRIIEEEEPTPSAIREDNPFRMNPKKVHYVFPDDYKDLLKSPAKSDTDYTSHNNNANNNITPSPMGNNYPYYTSKEESRYRKNNAPATVKIPDIYYSVKDTMSKMMNEYAFDSSNNNNTTDKMEEPEIQTAAASSTSVYWTNAVPMHTMPTPRMAPNSMNSVEKKPYGGLRSINDQMSDSSSKYHKTEKPNVTYTTITSVSSTVTMKPAMNDSTKSEPKPVEKSLSQSDAIYGNHHVIKSRPAMSIIDPKNFNEQKHDMMKKWRSSVITTRKPTQFHKWHVTTKEPHASPTMLLAAMATAASAASALGMGGGRGHQDDSEYDDDHSEEHHGSESNNLGWTNNPPGNSDYGGPPPWASRENNNNNNGGWGGQQQNNNNNRPNNFRNNGNNNNGWGQNNGPPRDNYNDYNDNRPFGNNNGPGHNRPHGNSGQRPHGPPGNNNGLHDNNNRPHGNNQPFRNHGWNNNNGNDPPNNNYNEGGHYSQPNGRPPRPPNQGPQNENFNNYGPPNTNPENFGSNNNNGWSSFNPSPPPFNNNNNPKFQQNNNNQFNNNFQNGPNFNNHFNGNQQNGPNHQNLHQGMMNNGGYFTSDVEIVSPSNSLGGIKNHPPVNNPLFQQISTMSAPQMPMFPTTMRPMDEVISILGEMHRNKHPTMKPQVDIKIYGENQRDPIKGMTTTVRPLFNGTDAANETESAPSIFPEETERSITGYSHDSDENTEERYMRMADRRSDDDAEKAPLVGRRGNLFDSEAHKRNVKKLLLKSAQPKNGEPFSYLTFEPRDSVTTVAPRDYTVYSSTTLIPLVTTPTPRNYKTMSSTTLIPPVFDGHYASSSVPKRSTPAPQKYSGSNTMYASSVPPFVHSTPRPYLSTNLVTTAVPHRYYGSSAKLSSGYQVTTAKPLASHLTYDHINTASPTGFGSTQKPKFNYGSTANPFLSNHNYETTERPKGYNQNHNYGVNSTPNPINGFNYGSTSVPNAQTQYKYSTTSAPGNQFQFDSFSTPNKQSNGFGYGSTAKPNANNYNSYSSTSAPPTQNNFNYVGNIASNNNQNQYNNQGSTPAPPSQSNYNNYGSTLNAPNTQNYNNFGNTESQTLNSNRPNNNNNNYENSPNSNHYYGSTQKPENYENPDYPETEDEVHPTEKAKFENIVNSPAFKQFVQGFIKILPGGVKSLDPNSQKELSQLGIIDYSYEDTSSDYDNKNDYQNSDTQSYSDSDDAAKKPLDNYVAPTQNSNNSLPLEYPTVSIEAPNSIESNSRRTRMPENFDKFIGGDTTDKSYGTIDVTKVNLTIDAKPDWNPNGDRSFASNINTTAISIADRNAGGDNFGIPSNLLGPNPPPLPKFDRVPEVQSSTFANFPVNSIVTGKRVQKNAELPEQTAGFSNDLSQNDKSKLPSLKVYDVNSNPDEVDITWDQGASRHHGFKRRNGVFENTKRRRRRRKSGKKRVVKIKVEDKGLKISEES